jgi:hypothetical protein
MSQQDSTESRQHNQQLTASSIDDHGHAVVDQRDQRGRQLIAHLKGLRDAVDPKGEIEQHI